MGSLLDRATNAIHQALCGTTDMRPEDGCVGCGASADAYVTAGCDYCRAAGEAFCWACIDSTPISLTDLTVFPGHQREE